MQDILKQISELSIGLNEFTFTDEQKQTGWLGNPPALMEEIKLAEKSLGVEFPQDYKDFLVICNGFSAPNDVEPTFERVDRINYLINIDDFLVEIWNEEPLIEEGKELARSILVAGINQEQYFLLVPPSSADDKWKYLKFANWIPGGQPFNDLVSYLNEVLTFTRRNI